MQNFIQIQHLERIWDSPKDKANTPRYIIGFDKTYKPRIFPQDLSAHYCITTRPYSGLRPKGWENENIALFSKLCHIEYGVLVHATNHLANCIYDKEELKYYSFVFSPTRFHRRLLMQNLRETKHLCKAMSVGFAKFEAMLSIPHNPPKSHNPPKNLTILYMPRWASGEYCTFMRYMDYFLKMAKMGKIKLIFRPHPNMYDHFVKTAQIITESQWQNLIIELETSPNTSLDSAPSPMESMKKANVIISDASSMLIYAFLSGKAVIYTQNELGGEVNNWALRWLRGCFIANNLCEIEELLLRLGCDYSAMMKSKISQREEILRQDFLFLRKGANASIGKILLNDFKMMRTKGRE